MNFENTKLVAPLIMALVILWAVTHISIETLGLVLKYGGGLISVGIIGLYLVVGIYTLVIRTLLWIGNAAWGDVLERHLDGEDISEEDIPHWSRIWISYITSLFREWLKGNFKWVTFRDYHEDMVSPLVEDYDYPFD